MVTKHADMRFNSAPNPTRKPAAERLFYSVATVLLLVLAVAGFQLFYFHGQAYPGRPLTPPIKTLIITHSAAMSLWMLLALVQPILVAVGHRRAHVTLGRVAAIIAVCLVVLGIRLGVAAERLATPGMMFGPLTPKQFMAVPVLTAVLFALFVAVGVLARKRPAVHRPMMFMASMTAVGAAVSRIDFFNHLYADTVFQKVFGDFFFTVVIAGVILLAKCIVSRSLDRWLAAGFCAHALWCIMVAQSAATPAWDAIAGFLLR